MILRGFLILMAIIKPLQASQTAIQLGDTTVTIQRLQNGKGKNFVHVHANETTALQSAKAVVRAQGGSLLTLKHRGTRNIVFNLDNKRYEFDPNRMFTDTGIKKTLQEFGNYSPLAHKEVKKLANALIELLPPGKIIAVHNNHDYSIKEYLPGQASEKEADAIHLDKKKFFRNFYLVTQKNDFDRLKALNFNIVKQISHATDDGSLSVYLANREYINVEAGYGQLAAQMNMLKNA